MANDSRKPIRNLKLCLVGDSNVGKTSIAARFIYNIFNPLTAHSIGAAYGATEIEVEKQKYMLHVWDTAGQERYSTMIPLYYRNTNAVIVVYDITRAESFSSLKVWIKEINLYTSPDILTVIVGNKSDLQENRKIEKKVGKRYAEELGALYIETSAADGSNIQEMFYKIARKLHRKSELQVEAETAAVERDSNREKCRCGK